MANVLIVSHTKSFMMSSLESQLEAQMHQVFHAVDTPNDIGKIKEEICLILLNA